MKHKVITIGCEYGAGIPRRSETRTPALGIEFYDRHLVDKVVEQIGVDRDLVKKADAGSNVLYSFETQYLTCKNLTNVLFITSLRLFRSLQRNLPASSSDDAATIFERPERCILELFRLCTGRSPDPGNDGKEKHWPERSGRTGEIS